MSLKNLVFLAARSWIFTLVGSLNKSWLKELANGLPSGLSVNFSKLMDWYMFPLNLPLPGVFRTCLLFLKGIQGQLQKKYATKMHWLWFFSYLLINLDSSDALMYPHVILSCVPSGPFRPYKLLAWIKFFVIPARKRLKWSESGLVLKQVLAIYTFRR